MACSPAPPSSPTRWPAARPRAPHQAGGAFATELAPRTAAARRRVRGHRAQPRRSRAPRNGDRARLGTVRRDCRAAFGNHHQGRRQHGVADGPAHRTARARSGSACAGMRRAARGSGRPGRRRAHHDWRWCRVRVPRAGLHPAACRRRRRGPRHRRLHVHLPPRPPCRRG